MATLSNVLEFTREISLTDINGLTDATGIIFANEARFDFHRRLTKAGIDATSIQEAYRDASIPSSGNGSTFLYPTDFMFLKAIEVNYSDTTPQNYIRANQVDHSNIPGEQSFSWLRLNQPTRQPLFADNGDWYELFPAFKSGDNISQAIRLIYFQKPTPYSSVSDSIAYPESLDDGTVLGWRIASNFYKSLNKFAEAENHQAEYERRVQDIIATQGRGAQQPLQATVIQETGWNF